jgi:hypothetical protein
MQIASRIQALLAAIGKLGVARPGFRFTCGDCDRNAQCGLPPHDDCTYRLMQIARDGDRPSRRNECLYPAVWPLTGRPHAIDSY